MNHGFDENHDDYDMPMELDSRSAVSNFSRLSRGIILLGDGSGFGIPTTGSSSSSSSGGGGMRIAGDVEMMDNDDEDRDLEAQVARHTPPSGSEEEDDDDDEQPGQSASAGERSRREETPGPQQPAAVVAADTLPSRAHGDTPTATTTATTLAAKVPELPKEQHQHKPATGDAAEQASSASADKPKEEGSKA